MFNHVEVKLPDKPVKTIEKNGKRHYVIDGEERTFPSVTTVTGHENEEFFREWRKNPDNLKISAAATSRGNKYHSLVEKYLGNEEINQDGDLFRYSKVHLDKINNIQALEVALWGDLYEILHDTYGRTMCKDFFGIAGRVDCIGEFDGTLSVIDFKTAKRPKEISDIQNYFLQATCYSLLWENLTGQPIENGVIIMACEDKSCSVYEFKTKDYIQELIRVTKTYTKKHGR